MADKLDEMIKEVEKEVEAESEKTLAELDPWANEELNRLFKFYADKNDPWYKSQPKHVQEAAELYRTFLDIYGAGNGYSGVTMDAFNKLTKGIPLTPVENGEDDWLPCKGSETEDYHRRCKFLIRTKLPDGSYEYSDERRCIGYENGQQFVMGLLVDILNEIEPVTFPYEPSVRPYIAYTMSFNAEGKWIKKVNESFRGGHRADTFGIFSILRPDGKVIKVGKYFRYEGKERVEITYTEFKERLELFNNRVKNAVNKLNEEAYNA